MSCNCNKHYQQPSIPVEEPEEKPCNCPQCSEQSNNETCFDGNYRCHTRSNYHHHHYPCPKNEELVTNANNCSCLNTGDMIHTTTEPAEYNFRIYKGTSVDFEIVYKDSQHNPVNLTGYTARLIAQYNDKTFTMHANIVNKCAGKIALSMSAYETSKIFTLSTNYADSTQYTYQLNIIAPSKFVYRVMQGIIDVVPSAGNSNCGCGC